MNTYQTYENAPATKLLATHCACCGRPLVDASSVETGVGPECRRKFGYEVSDSEPNWENVLKFLSLADFPVENLSREPREMANKVVYRIAAKQNSSDVPHLINALFALGYSRLADRIADRVIKIRVVISAGKLYLSSPYSPVAIKEFNKILGKQWHNMRKQWCFPISAKNSIFDALKAAFPGHLAIGSKGIFVIPER